MEPLKKLQVEDFLMFAEPQDLFCNLDELCYVSVFTLLIIAMTIVSVNTYVSC